MSKNNPNGDRPVAWIDLTSLGAFLLPHGLDRLDRTFLLYPGDQGYLFLVIAGVLPVLIVIGAIGFESFQASHARMQIALESSRHRLLTISDNLVEGIVMVDSAGTILFTNRAAMEMLECGDDITTVKGRDVEETMRMEDGTALPWRDALHDGRRQIFDDVRIKGREEVLDVTMTLSPLEDSEAGRGLVVTFRDIKALKHAQ